MRCVTDFVYGAEGTIMDTIALILVSTLSGHMTDQ